MKKRYYFLIALILIVFIWVISMLIPLALTAIFGDEFSDFNAIDYSTMYPDEMEYRVMYYSSKKAIVYFWIEDGYGEQVEFKKDKNGNWKENRCLASWSKWGGSAEDYFIWPYFTDHVW